MSLPVDPRSEAVPAWVREKERDNAVILVHELLASGEVDEPVFTQLKDILAEANITVTSLASRKNSEN